MQLGAMRHVSLSVLLLAALAATDGARAHWSFDGQVGLGYDDNLGNARSGSDMLGDHALSGALTATQTHYLESGDSFSWGGRLAAERWSHYRGLDNMALGGTLSYRRKLALGPYAPWWRLAWSTAALSYRQDQRNAWLHQADFTAGKRFSERCNAALSLHLEKRDADSQPREAPGISGDAYSQLARAIGLSAEYAINGQWQLSLGGLVRRGDVLSTSTRYREVFLAAKAIADDPALGENRYAYRLNGTSYLVNAGLAWTLSADTHLAVGLQRALTHGEGHNNYAKNAFSLSWMGSF